MAIINKRKIEREKKNKYDIDTILANKYKKLSKDILCTPGEIASFVTKISFYVTAFVYELIKDSNLNIEDSIIDYLEKEGEELEHAFKMSQFYDFLKLNSEKKVPDVYNFYKNKSGLYNARRREINDIALYEMIKDGGAICGPERALLFAKVIINCDSTIPMQYRAQDENYVRFVKVYEDLYRNQTSHLIDEIRNSIENVECLPDYFNENAEDKYKIELLSDIVNSFTEDDQKKVRDIGRQKVYR